MQWSRTAAPFFAALSVGLTGCLYAPDPQAVPEDVDQPPYYFPEDVSPPAGSTVAVLLQPAAGGGQFLDSYTFSIGNLYERTPNDVINATWFIETDDHDQTVGNSAELTAVTLESGIGRYQSPTFTLQACTAPLDGSLSTFRVRLRLRDEIPPADRALVGATSYELNLVWIVRVTGAC